MRAQNWLLAGRAGTSDSPIIKRIEGKETEKNEKGKIKRRAKREKNSKYSIYETNTYMLK